MYPRIGELAVLLTRHIIRLKTGVDKFFDKGTVVLILEDEDYSSIQCLQGEDIIHISKEHLARFVLPDSEETSEK